MKDDEPIVYEYFAGWTTVGQHVAVGHAVAEILFGGLLQQTGGLPAANLLRQAVATAIPGDWAPLPDQLIVCELCEKSFPSC